VSEGVGLHLSAVTPEVLEPLLKLQMDEKQKLILILQMVGMQTIAYLRSLTSEMRPPGRKPSGIKTGVRRAHPGHWADLSGQLANAYSWEVIDRGNEVVLVLRNSAEYAMWLELRDGFFVLSGVTEPGGPVMKALEVIVPQVAPGWSVRIA
jgi:hypothetical protein